MDDMNHMTLEKFKLWSTNALRVFLSVRNKSVKGNLDELTARAFIAWEENITIDQGAEQQQLCLLAEYKAKLKVDGTVIPDPLSLSTGWKSEKIGMSQWPALYINDISNYLNTNTANVLVDRLVNEYKVGKAYRYFTGEWVKEIFYHDIDLDSPVCVVKSKVTPSQAVNCKPYDVWIVLEKNQEEKPGGRIHNAYCSCTAGMLGSCNHIAGVLFRIEHAVKLGLTCNQKSSTSKLCDWIVPKTKTVIKPGQIADTVWKKSHYMKNPQDSNKENEASAKKKAFTPLRKCQEKDVDNTKKMRSDLHRLLSEDIPDSCFSLLMEKRKIVTKEQSLIVPPSLIMIAKNICSKDLNDEEKKMEFSKSMVLTDDEIKHLHDATVSQSDSDCWSEQRRGRITASKFYSVTRRAQTLQKNPNEDPTCILDTIMGTDGEKFQNAAMKHGISTEPVAKRVYIKNMKSSHKKFKADNSGIVVLKEKPFISASPDLYVSCYCCGEGLCEIKCPDSIKGEAPSLENVPWLRSKDNEIVLTRNHQYFYQIQGQMGITGRKYCDCFIFTHYGNLCVRVPFEEEVFTEIVVNVSWLFNNHVIDRLLKKDCILLVSDTKRSEKEVKRKL